MALGATAYGADQCQSGLAGDHKCIEYTVRDGYDSQALMYPYICNKGNKCQYTHPYAPTVTRDCQCIGAFEYGYCPIIMGVNEFSEYRRVLRPLVAASATCPRSVQKTLALSAELMSCTTATAAEK